MPKATWLRSWSRGPTAPGEIIGRVDVETETVDHFCAAHGIDHIDILKADTQGYELEVLTGARGLIDAGRIRALLVEITFTEQYKDQPRHFEVMRFIDDLGFSLYGLYGVHRQAGQVSHVDALYLNRS